MLNKAAVHRDRLVAAGMSASLLDDLGRAVEGLRGTFDGSHNARRDQVGATKSIKETLREIMLQAKLLDGLVAYRFGDDPERMGGWRSARDVFGPIRRRKPEPLNGDGAFPGAAGGVVQEAVDGVVPIFGNGTASGADVAPAA